MLLTRQNAKGGKKLTGFPIREENGTLGYLLGYCTGCNEAVLMALQDRDLVVAQFHYNDQTLEKLKKILNPKISFRQALREWFIRQLGGQVASAVHNSY